MQADEFVLYAYASVMLPILVAMFIGLLLLGIPSHRNFKEKERHDLEDFIYRLQCKIESESNLWLYQIADSLLVKHCIIYRDWFKSIRLTKSIPYPLSK